MIAKQSPKAHRPPPKPWAEAEAGASDTLPRAIAAASAKVIFRNMVCTPLWMRMRVLLILHLSCGEPFVLFT